MRGRLLYAITQYVMNKVFNNQYQPFKHDDTVNEKQYPELLAYYRNTVLPACKHYLQELDIQFQRRMEEELAARSSLRM